MRNANRFNVGILIHLLFSLVQIGNAQAPVFHWQKCIGGSGDEAIYNMIQLKDGNYLFCGYSSSKNGDINTPHGKNDALLVKTDALGNIIWAETYGGSLDEAFYNLLELKNGDILAIGITSSNNQQVKGHHGVPGTDDVWLVKTNKAGQFKKQNCYGGSGSEGTFDLGESEGLLIDSHGDILFTAETNSNDGDVSNNHGDYDGWVVKLTRSLKINWAITIGDKAYDALYTISEINGNYLVCGTKATRAYANFPNVEEFFKAHAAKLGPTGNIIWYRIYGGNGSDDCNAAINSADGNLVLTGHTSSTDGDVVGNQGFNTWTWKIDVNNNGDILWQNFQGIARDTAAAFNVTPTQDGGYVAMGAVGKPSSGFDSYAVKLDSKGITQWTKRFGGSEYDGIQCGMEKNNGNILMGGMTSSNNGDAKGNHGGPGDAWLIELKFQ